MRQLTDIPTLDTISAAVDDEAPNTATAPYDENQSWHVPSKKVELRVQIRVNLRLDIKAWKKRNAWGRRKKKARPIVVLRHLCLARASNGIGSKKIPVISDSYGNDVEMRIENELNKVVGFLYAKMPNEELVVTLDQDSGVGGGHHYIFGAAWHFSSFKGLFFSLCWYIREVLIEGNGFRKVLLLLSAPDLTSKLMFEDRGSSSSRALWMTSFPTLQIISSKYKHPIALWKLLFKSPLSLSSKRAKLL